MAKKENNITNFNEHLTGRYGERGSERRTEFEIKAKAFLIGELIKEERKNAKMTQEQLADKIGAKKSFISRIENGKTDIQLSTLYRLLEFGLGKTETSVDTDNRITKFRRDMAGNKNKEKIRQKPPSCT